MRSITKRIETRYNAWQYKIFEEQVTEITRQAVAMMLYALSLNGYGTKHLNATYEMFLDILNMPKVFDKMPECDDAMKMLTEKHGIDFSRINPHFQSYAEYARENR